MQLPDVIYILYDTLTSVIPAVRAGVQPVPVIRPPRLLNRSVDVVYGIFVALIVIVQHIAHLVVQVRVKLA